MGFIRPVQPGSVKPQMSQMYNGLNVATRPIPVITDYGDVLAAKAAAADQRPRTEAVNMPSKPRPSGADTVFGTQVPGSYQFSGGVYNPASGVEETL
jgi:hypothetical protein